MRDELGAIYEDEVFARLFPNRGQPAETPWRLALVTIFQFAENLPDRQAADAVRGRIDWKYALSLQLEDPGFDASVLSEFRTRLVEGGAELLLLDILLERFRELGLLKARGKQRTDSTHVLAAIRTLNRLTLVGETLRHALNELAEADPDWLLAHVEADWFERYSRRVEEYRLPKADTERKVMAATIGADGFRLLAAIYSPAAPTELRGLSSVEALRRVWIQQYYAPQEDGPVRWRDPKDLPPGALLIVSPYDIEARLSTKRGDLWTGYKMHVTETCDEDSPHLITHVETTAATTPDAQAVTPIHQALESRRLLPKDHLLDAGYVDSRRLVESEQGYGVNLIGPVPADGGWQAREDNGFGVSCFTVDWEAKTVTCPAGANSAEWKPTHDRHRKDTIHVEFNRDTCRACDRRSDCTRSKSTGRELTLRPREQHEALQSARQRQLTDDFWEQYAMRAGVEGTLSQGIRAFELRQARYIGLAKTRLQNVIIAVAINLVRAVAWLMQRDRAQTRQSRFAALASRHQALGTA